MCGKGSRKGLLLAGSWFPPAPFTLLAACALRVCSLLPGQRKWGWGEQARGKGGKMRIHTLPPWVAVQSPGSQLIGASHFSKTSAKFRLPSWDFTGVFCVFCPFTSKILLHFQVVQSKPNTLTPSIISAAAFFTFLPECSSIYDILP